MRSLAARAHTPQSQRHLPTESGRRASVPPSVRSLFAAGVFLTSACGSGPTETVRESNVTVISGAGLTTTDDAVLVGGAPRISLGESPRGMFVQHSTEYTYGGLHERINDELVGESWYMDVGRTIVTRENEDTIFYRALDFGDVALEGTPARNSEVDTVRVNDAGERVRVYENGDFNRIFIYSQRTNLDGSSVSFTHEPFYERMVAGGELELTASGSDDIEPLSTTLTLRPGARVTGLWNGEDLDFERQRPVLRPDEDLVIDLDRPLDPDRVLLRLQYAPHWAAEVDREIVRNARAVFQLQGRTDRVVIPASALTEVASHLPEGVGGFVFRIYEYLVKDPVMEIVRVADGTPEELSGLQVNVFGFYLRMRR